MSDVERMMAGFRSELAIKPMIMIRLSRHSCIRGMSRVVSMIMMSVRALPAIAPARKSPILEKTIPAIPKARPDRMPRAMEREPFVDLDVGAYAEACHKSREEQ